MAMLQLSLSSRSLVVLVVTMLLHSTQAVLLPIVPLPISFNFGGSSPLSVDVACTWGQTVEIDGQKQVRQQCGAARYAWRVAQESGAGSGSEVFLGPLAAQQKLSLSLSPTRGPAGAGVLSRSGTYLVQLTISYDKCDKEAGQTRINLGPCPSSSEAGSSSSSSTQSCELQSCKEVSEPGKRKLTLNSGSKAVSWQLLPTGGAGSSVSTEAGAAPLSCSGGGCVLLVGSGASRVQPGRSYAIRYSTGSEAASAAQQQQQGASIGLNVGIGGLGFGLGAAGSGSGGWQELKGLTVDKCPPRVTRSAAGLMGSCGSSSGRWLEMQAAAVDLEEGAAATLKYYWYVKSARTQDVVQEASGPSVKLEIGQPGSSSSSSKLPGGRRYTVDLLVTSQAGGQVSSSRETLSGVVDVPAC